MKERLGKLYFTLGVLFLLTVSAMLWFGAVACKTFSAWEKYYKLSGMAPVKVREQRLAVDTESHVLCVASVRG